MLEEQRAVFVVAGVVEAFAVGREVDAGIARGGQLIFERLFGLDVENVNDVLVGAALFECVGEQIAVAGNGLDGDGSVGIAAEGGGIDQPFVFARTQPWRT